jgi:hypothetical protein
MDNFKIQLAVANQYDEAHDESWAYRMCAPCALWMLIKHANPEFNLTPVQVKEELLAAGGYLENVGFKHNIIAEVGNRHGLRLTYAKKFFYTREEKEIGMMIINKNLAASQPVMVSMYSHFTPARGGHMVVVQGVEQFRDQTIGYHIQSSDATFKGHNYFVTKEEFVSNWRGGMIYMLD